jgi:hypothetical protein
MEHRPIDARLDEEPNVWLASARPGRAPHLVPIWFVWVAGRFWLCTCESRKTRNIEIDSNVTVALENGNAPIVAEGTASLHRRPYPADVKQAFGEKYQWDIDRPDNDGEYEVLIEIEPTRWVFGAPAQPNAAIAAS